MLQNVTFIPLFFFDLQRFTWHLWLMIDTGYLLASETKYKRLVILKSVSIVNPLLSSTISVVADGEFRDVNT